MNKQLIIALSLMATVSLVGCSSTNNTNDTNKPESSIESKSEGEKDELITYSGKINKIVGNELEIELAKEVIESADTTGPIGGNDSNSNEVVINDIGEAVAMGATPPAEEPANDVAVGETIKTQVEDAEEEDIEYTGEKKNLVVPTGATVVDARTGKDVNISDIKDGAVINVQVKDVDGKLIVYRIDIMG